MEVLLHFSLCNVPRWLFKSEVWEGRSGGYLANRGHSASFLIHRSESRWRFPLPKGGLVRGYDKPTHGSCPIYFPGGVDVSRFKFEAFSICSLMNAWQCCEVTGENTTPMILERRSLGGAHKEPWNMFVLDVEHFELQVTAIIDVIDFHPWYPTWPCDLVIFSQSREVLEKIPWSSYGFFLNAIGHAVKFCQCLGKWIIIIPMAKPNHILSTYLREPIWAELSWGNGHALANMGILIAQHQVFAPED